MFLARIRTKQIFFTVNYHFYNCKNCLLCIGRLMSCQHLPYFQVERTSYKDRTVTIARGCADICLYGCYASGFGVTKLTCTACCQDRGCNTTNTAARIITDSMECILILHVFVIFMFCRKITSGQNACVI